MQNDILEVLEFGILVSTNRTVKEELEGDVSRHGFHEEVQSHLEESFAVPLVRDIWVLFQVEQGVDGKEPHLLLLVLVDFFAVLR